MTVYVQASGSDSIGSGAYEKVTGLSLSEIDPTGAPSPWNSTNQQVVCITGEAGIYEFNACAQWATTFSSLVTLRFVVNGTTAHNIFNGQNNSATSGVVMCGTRRIRLAEGDVVELQARQFSGSSKTLNVEEFSAQWIRA